MLDEQRGQRSDHDRAGDRRDPPVPAQAEETAAGDALQERPAAGDGYGRRDGATGWCCWHAAEASSALSHAHEAVMSSLDDPMLSAS
jgi:hypothetical protein